MIFFMKINKIQALALILKVVYTYLVGAEVITENNKSQGCTKLGNDGGRRPDLIKTRSFSTT